MFARIELASIFFFTYHIIGHGPRHGPRRSRPAVTKSAASCGESRRAAGFCSRGLARCSLARTSLRREDLRGCVRPSSNAMRTFMCFAVAMAVLSMAGGASAGLSPAALRPGHGPIVPASSSRKLSLAAGHSPRPAPCPCLPGGPCPRALLDFALVIWLGVVLPAIMLKPPAGLAIMLSCMILPSLPEASGACRR